MVHAGQSAGWHGDMCSHYSIFAPEKLSFPGRKSAYRILLRKVTLFSAKSISFVVY